MNTQSATCRACKFEAELGTEEIPHPIDPRVHTCIEPNENVRAILRLRFAQGDDRDLRIRLLEALLRDVKCYLDVDTHQSCRLAIDRALGER